jgi:hypothetical protein
VTTIGSSPDIKGAIMRGAGLAVADAAKPTIIQTTHLSQFFMQPPP